MKLKQSIYWSALLLMLVAGIIGRLGAGEREQTFRGEVGDSQCALNVHSLTRSHKEMLKRKAIGKTAADCARYCVKYLGGVFVLQVKDKVYKLDNQKLADIYAGQKVIVTGTLDAQTDTIAVESIVPAKRR
jgi:hypothetical protein